MQGEHLMARRPAGRQDARKDRRTSGSLPPHGGGAMIGRRSSRDTMSTRSTQPAAPDLSLVDEVASLAADVPEEVARLRPLVDGRAIDANNDLTVLLGALNAVAGKL